MSITVIDAPCGAGKTTWAIREMDSNPDQAYIYCTPFLDEIKRIKRSSKKHRFREPVDFDTTKIEDFNRLLGEGVDIAVTHKTFLNATPETLELIEQGQYTLVLDEALDVLVDFNNTDIVEKDPTQKILKGKLGKPGDFDMLLNMGIIEVGADKKVCWKGNEYPEGKFSGLARMINLGRVYLVDRSMFVCVFPPEVFRLFEKVYILTYQFEGNPIAPYFKMFNIDYEKMTMGKAEGVTQPVPFTEDYDAEFRRKAKELITLVADKDRMFKGGLSKNWYGNNKPKKGYNGKSTGYQRIKTQIIHYRKKWKVKAKYIMWTAPKDYKDYIKGNGYTEYTQYYYYDDEGTRVDIEPNDKDEVEVYAEIKHETVECFVPCNAKATNDFRERWALFHCFNMWYPTEMKKLFTDRGIEFDNQAWALSCLVQWVWRSRIRDGKRIKLYIASERMNDLFVEWLEGKGTRKNKSNLHSHAYNPPLDAPP